MMTKFTRPLPGQISSVAFVVNMAAVATKIQPVFTDLFL